MKPLRLSLFALIVVEAVTVAYMGKGTAPNMMDARILPILCSVIAVISLVDPLRITIRNNRKRLGYEILALFFIGKWRFFLGRVGLIGKLSTIPSDYMFMYNLAQYLLLIQALELLFISIDSSGRRRSLIHFIPLCAVGVMISISDFLTPTIMRKGEDILAGFTILSSFFIFFFAIVVMLMRPKNIIRRTSWIRYVWCGLILAIVIPLGAWSSHLLHENQNKLDTTFVKLMGFNTIRGGTTGFSQQATLDSITSSRANEPKRTMLRVESDRKPGYFRALAYESYENNQWLLAPEGDTIYASDHEPQSELQQNRTDRFFELRPNVEQEMDSMKVWPHSSLKELMFMPATTSWLTAPVDSLVVDENKSVAAPDIISGTSYNVLSSDQPLQEELSKNMRARYTVVPEDLDPRIVDLADSLFKGSTATLAKVNTVEQHFRDNYKYELGIQVPRNTNPLTYFLLEQPAAHCEYFATGAAILLRIAGVPCRYVTGFVVSEEHPFGGYWIARNTNAHAWVEVWDENTGWTIVEATPGDGVPSSNKQAFAGYLIDYAKLQFQKLIVFLKEGLKALFLSVVSMLWNVISNTIPGRIIILLAISIITYTYIKKIRRKSKQELSPEIMELRPLLRKMDKRVAKKGFRRQPEETIIKFSKRIAEAEIDEPWLLHAVEWYRNYSRLRFRGKKDDNDIDQLRCDFRS